MIKKFLSALALTLALGTAVPAVVHAAPASFVVAKTTMDNNSTTSTSAKNKNAKAVMKSKNTKGGKLNINTCTVKELTGFHGIGVRTASKIVMGRPYKGRNDLLSRKIVTAKQYAGIKDFIVAGQKGGRAMKKSKNSKM